MDPKQVRFSIVADREETREERRPRTRMHYASNETKCPVMRSLTATKHRNVSMATAEVGHLIGLNFQATTKI